MHNYLTTAQVAKILGVTRVRVWQLIVREKVLHGTKIGSIWVVEAKDVRTYLANKGSKTA